mmetsp:Transcript_63527/g.138357  ORF Transcript_63527/g.138357 Transcript_63527/m.138357 type:complete len:160 (-) Transcript_63527:311-790(-)
MDVADGAMPVARPGSHDATSLCSACGEVSQRPSFDYVCPVCEALICWSCVAALEVLACPACGDEERNAIPLRTQKAAIRATTGARQFFGRLQGFVREVADKVDVAAKAAVIREPLRSDSKSEVLTLEREEVSKQGDAPQYFVDYCPLDRLLLPPEYLED